MSTGDRERRGGDGACAAEHLCGMCDLAGSGGVRGVSPRQPGRDPLPPQTGILLALLTHLQTPQVQEFGEYASRENDDTCLVSVCVVGWGGREGGTRTN